eukprot:1242375-Amphidinium_carterae.1
MVWRQSVAYIRRASMANGMYNSSIYFRRAEDFSIEFVPNHLEAHSGNTGQEAAMFNLEGAMGKPIGVWNIDRVVTAWCEQNNLLTILNKYVEVDGKTIKQQSVTTDNSVEHDHNQAMALHRWHRDNAMVLTNQLIAIRVNNAGNMAQTCNGQAQ